MSMPSDTAKNGEGSSDESLFAGSFDLYNSGKRRRGGMRRVEPATPAVTPVSEPVPTPQAEANAALREPRSFTSSPTPVEPTADLDRSPAPPPVEPVLGGMSSTTAEDDVPLMPATGLYTTRRSAPRSAGRRNGLAFGVAAAALAAVAAGAWFLMTPSQTSEQADVVATAPLAPAPAPAMPAPMPEPMPVPPVATAPPPAPVQVAEAPRASTTRANAAAERARTASNAAQRQARRAAASADAAAANASDTAPEVTTYLPPPVTAASPPVTATPAPVISAPPPAPPAPTTPTPGADPSGAVNPPSGM